MRVLVALTVAIALGACSARLPSAAPQAGGGLLPAVLAAAPATKIQHVVIVVQENRSFDNFFSTYPGADGATSGKCYRNGKTSTIQLKKVDLPSPIGEPPYAWSSFQTEYDHGKMDGFCRDTYGNTLPYDLAYQYVDPQQIKPYWTIAQQYVLADRFFQTQQSGSFTAHQDLIRGDTVYDPTHSIIDNPVTPPNQTFWGCAAPKGTYTRMLSSTLAYSNGPYPCFTWRTLRNLLNGAHLSWKYYTPSTYPAGHGGNLWNAFFAIKDVYEGPQWSTNVTNTTPYEKTFFSDVKNGNLPAVSWVVPDYANSDHSGEAQDTGPSWVGQIVNAVGSSSYWKSTAIVIVWDDWGGWYDHVKPPQIYYDGLSFRVPALVVSAYAKPGHISHTQYEFASILRFIEDNWGLGQLNKHDANANSIADVFDFTQKPIVFRHIGTKYSLPYFLQQKPSNQPVDDR